MIKLINGDSREVLKTFPENHFSSCVTDPPYGLTSITDRFGNENSAPAKAGKDGRFSRLSKGFLGKEWDGTGIERDPEFWKEVLRVLKPGSYLLSFSGARTSHRIASAIEDAGFEIRNMIGWLYSQGFPKSHDLGDGWGTELCPAFEPIIMARKPIKEKTNIRNREVYGTAGINIEASRIPLAEGEIIPVNVLENWSGFGQEVRPKYIQKQNTKGRWPKNFIIDDEVAESIDDMARFYYCAKPSKKEKGVAQGHPSVKPIEVMKYLITLVTPEGGIVVDPFMGSNSTGIACYKLGYDFVGMEGDDDYFKLAVQRTE